MKLAHVADLFFHAIDKIAFFLLVRCLHLSFLENNWEKFMQFVKFCMVGLSNTLISYVFYLIGIWFGMHYLLASVLGFVISVIHSFYWNNNFVFQSKDNSAASIIRKFVKTFLSYLSTGLILANILLVIQVQYLGIPEVIAPLVNLVITIPLNFLINKFWAFRKA